jgi:hypothetical protein
MKLALLLALAVVAAYELAVARELLRPLACRCSRCAR